MKLTLEDYEDKSFRRFITREGDMIDIHHCLQSLAQQGLRQGGLAKNQRAKDKDRSRD